MASATQSSNPSPCDALHTRLHSTVQRDLMGAMSRFVSAREYSKGSSLSGAYHESYGPMQEALMGIVITRDACEQASEALSFTRLLDERIRAIDALQVQLTQRRAMLDSSSAEAAALILCEATLRVHKDELAGIHADALPFLSKPAPTVV